MKNSRGFSLVELMVVVAIIGALAGVATLSLTKARPGYQLQKAAREVVSAFRMARSMAVKYNRSVNLEFNTSGSFYTLSAPGISKRVPASGKLEDYYGSGISFGFPGRSDGVHFTGGSSSSTITFNTTGLTGGVTGYVYLKNREKQGYRIGISSLAANIKIDKCRSTDSNGLTITCLE